MIDYCVKVFSLFEVIYTEVDKNTNTKAIVSISYGCSKHASLEDIINK